MYDRHQLHSSINFAMHKIKPGTVVAGTVKSNFKATTKRFVAYSKEHLHNGIFFI